MGRIHRYGQKHDPVIILNLVAAKTREGRVLKTLLDKLEKIRKQLKSDKVFDVIGRIFEGVSIRQYMEEALTEEGAQSVAERLEGQLTKEQVQALAERDKRLFGDGGDVCKELPRLRTDIERESYAQLLPGYVRRFISEAAPLLDIGAGRRSRQPVRRQALEASRHRPLAAGAGHLSARPARPLDRVSPQAGRRHDLAASRRGGLRGPAGEWSIADLAQRRFAAEFSSIPPRMHLTCSMWPWSRWSGVLTPQVSSARP